MASTKDKMEFAGILARELVPGMLNHEQVAGLADQLLRKGARLHRLAEAECNGDYPCDNGDRPVEWCIDCGSGYVPWVMRKGQCPACRIAREVDRLVEPFGITAIHQGDPRGAVLKLKMPSGYVNDWSREGVVVPA